MSLVEMLVVTSITCVLAGGLAWFLRGAARSWRAPGGDLPLSGLWGLHDELLHARLVRAGFDRSPRDARTESLQLVDRDARFAILSVEPAGLVLRRFDPLRPEAWESKVLLPEARAVLFDLRVEVGAVRFHVFTDRSSLIGSVRPLDVELAAPRSPAKGRPS